MDVSRLVQELDQELDTDPRDDDERAVDERRIALDERQQPADDEPHRHDAQEAARQDHPIFGDIATATRIESMAKTMSVNSTFTTVAQNALSPSHGFARGGVLGTPRRERSG